MWCLRLDVGDVTVAVVRDRGAGVRAGVSVCCEKGRASGKKRSPSFVDNRKRGVMSPRERGRLTVQARHSARPSWGALLPAAGAECARAVDKQCPPGCSIRRRESVLSWWPERLVVDGCVNEGSRALVRITSRSLALRERRGVWRAHALQVATRRLRRRGPRTHRSVFCPLLMRVARAQMPGSSSKHLHWQLRHEPNPFCKLLTLQWRVSIRDSAPLPL